MWLIVALLATQLAPAIAASCGPNSIPFSLEALIEDGQSILGCARPTCFGWDASGRAAHFHKGSDKFFRKLSNSKLEPLEEPSLHQQNAMGLSIDRGIASVHPGQMVLGGEVQSAGGRNGKTPDANLKEGRQYAFDYVSGMNKRVENEGVVYEVNIRRMPCLPHPPEIHVEGEGVGVGLG